MSHRTKHMQASGEWRPDQTPSRLSVQFTGRRLIAGTYFKNSRGCLIFTIKIFICQIVLLVVLKTTSLPCRTVWLIHRGTWEIFNRSDIQSLLPRSGIRPSSQVNKRVFVGLHDWIRQMSPSWRVVHLWFWISDHQLWDFQLTAFPVLLRNFLDGGIHQAPPSMELRFIKFPIVLGFYHITSTLPPWLHSCRI